MPASHQFKPSVQMGFAWGNASAAAPAQVVLGIDPGLNRTGYAVLRRTLRGPQLLEGGVCRTKPDSPLEERVLDIGVAITELIAEYTPDAVAIEQLFSQPRHPKSALLMAHARGAILLSVAQARIPIMHYTPRQVKRLLTGSGAASKEQVQQAVRFELKLKSVLEPNDVADACAISLCHFHTMHVSAGVAAAAPA